MTIAPPPIAGDLTNAATTCVLCSHNCGLRVDVADNRITAVRADETNPLTLGYSCNKAYRISHYNAHRQRVTEPLERQADGSYRPVSWDHAVSAIGGTLRTLRERHGPDSLAMLGLGGQGHHIGVLSGLALQLGWGSRWWFNALAQEKTQRALVDRWMVDAPSHVMLAGHFEEADYALLLGSNPALSQRGPEPGRMLAAFRRDPARTLVVADPRVSETARKADLHLPVGPGTDVYLLTAIAAIIAQEALYDADFVSWRTTGFSAIADRLRTIDRVDMARRCGLDPTTVEAVARGLAGAERGSIEIDLGVEQSRFNTLTAYLVRLILALTGNYGRPGGAVFVGGFVPAAPRIRNPPKAPVSGIEGVALLAPMPMFSPNLFAEEVLRDSPDRIRAAIVDGSNPLLTYADTRRVRAAFEQLELSVVIETSMTETARVADYVLPAPTNYEKWAYGAFPKPFPLLGVQVCPPVVTGPPDALHESEIYQRLGRAMGLTRRAPWPVRLAARRAMGPLGTPIFFAVLMPLALLYARSLRRAAAMALAWVHETLGARLAAPQLAIIWLLCQAVALTRRRDIQRELPALAKHWLPTGVGDALFEEVMAHPEGVVLGRTDPAANLDENLGHGDGRIRLAPEPMLDELARALASPVQPDPAYPFVLNGGMRTHWTANTNMRDPAWRKGRGPHCALRMNPDDGARASLVAGQRVRVSSRRGHVDLPLKLEAAVQPGHVHIPNGFGTAYPDPETGALRTAGVNINELTDDQARDPFTGCPHHKMVRCRVEAAPV